MSPEIRPIPQMLPDATEHHVLQEHAATADIFLELSENIRLVPIRLLLRLADFGLPVVLFGGEFNPGARRLETAGYWKFKGHKVFLPLTREELREKIILMTAKHRIERTQALLLGSRFSSPYVVTSLPDFGAALRTLGIKIQSCKVARFMEIYKTAEKAQVSQLVDEWSQGAERIVEPKEDDLQKSALFYLAIKCILGEYGADAFDTRSQRISPRGRGERARSICVLFIRIKKTDSFLFPVSFVFTEERTRD